MATPSSGRGPFVNSASAELARHRLDALPDAVLVADENARYVDANAAALRLLGYTLTELRALGVSDVVAHGAAWTTTEFERFRQSGLWEGRLIVRSKSQTPIVVEVRATVLRLADRIEHLAVLREQWIPGTVPIAIPASESDAPLLTLTAREREVLALVADGASSAQIAAHLDISPRTADGHRLRIMRKLGVDSIAGLVRYAIRYRLTRAD